MAMSTRTTYAVSTRLTCICGPVLHGYASTVSTSLYIASCTEVHVVRTTILMSGAMATTLARALLTYGSTVLSI